MTLAEEHQRRADALLRLATAADNMRDRSRLIQEAVAWHNLAIEADEERTGSVGPRESAGPAPGP